LHANAHTEDRKQQEAVNNTGEEEKFEEQRDILQQVLREIVGRREKKFDDEVARTGGEMGRDSSSKNRSAARSLTSSSS
jgi:hypothetical protein